MILSKSKCQGEAKVTFRSAEMSPDRASTYLIKLHRRKLGIALAGWPMHAVDGFYSPDTVQLFSLSMMTS